MIHNPLFRLSDPKSEPSCLNQVLEVTNAVDIKIVTTQQDVTAPKRRCAKDQQWRPRAKTPEWVVTTIKEVMHWVTKDCGGREGINRSNYAVAVAILILTFFKWRGEVCGSAFSFNAQTLFGYVLTPFKFILAIWLPLCGSIKLIWTRIKKTLLSQRIPVTKIWMHQSEHLAFGPSQILRCSHLDPTNTIIILMIAEA